MDYSIMSKRIHLKGANSNGSIQWLGYTLGNHEITVQSWQGQETSLFSTASRLFLGATYPSIDWQMGPLSIGVKHLLCKADH
jgi:hypothetical protein